MAKTLLQTLRLDPQGDTPVYRQIADAIAAEMAGGRLRDGDRLPPTRDLARRLGVNRNTVVSAYDALAAEGLVRSRTGAGTFVEPAPGGAPPAAASDGDTWFNWSHAGEAAVAGGLQAIYSLAVDSAADDIAFVGSYPADELLPRTEFAAAMRTALAEGGGRVLSYGPTAGDAALRETIAAAMRAAGSRADAEQVLVTNGAQQGLDLVFRAFVDRGDAVIVEEPTYTGALSVLGALGARVVGVPVDDHGVRPDLLELALERHRPSLIYLQPTFQNPTTTVMPLERRRQVLELVRRHRCAVVEDDWGSDLRLDGEHVPTLHSLDGGAHVIYLSTFSKKLMPGLRLGWLVAPPSVLERVVELKRLQDCGTSPVLQSALQVFLRDGGLAEHLDRVLPVYRERRDRMLAALERRFPADATWSVPAGGLFVWLTLPDGMDARALFAAAAERGVVFSRGELFHTDGSGRGTMRLTYSTVTPERIERGITVLGTLLRDGLGGSAAASDRATEALPIF